MSIKNTFTTFLSTVLFSAALVMSTPAQPGSLDPTFGDGGKVIDGVAVSHEDYGWAVAVQPDGKLVAAGSSYHGLYADFALVRYNLDGSLDTTFDSDGKVTTPIGTLNDVAYSVAIQPDGKIVAAGTSGDYLTYDFVMVRYNTDGSLDTTFDSDGKLTTPMFDGRAGMVHAIAIQPDGKIVAAGSDGRFALVRYNPDGSLDTTFDSDGRVTTSIGTFGCGARDIVIQPDGKIVAAGHGYNGSNLDFALVRYNPDGSLDTTFDADGKVTTPIGASYDQAHGVTVQADGKIVAAGYTHDGSNHDFALVRYNSNGSLDTTFDSDGKITTQISAFDDRAYAVAIQPDGKIVTAGTSGQYLNDFAIVRYNPDGSLDTTFDSDGTVTTSIGTLNDEALAVAVQPDGKIVAAGHSVNGEIDFALVRYNQNGSLDTTFDADGKVTTKFEFLTGILFDVAIQPDGKIVTVGLADGGVVARYNSDGTRDATFGITGIVSPGPASSVAIQQDGKIVAAGTYHGSGFALVRYNTDGSLDATFDGDGIVTNEPSYQLGHILIQDDGKILIAGSYCAGYDEDGNCVSLNFALARVNTDGTFDTSFDTDGIVTTPLGGYNAYINSVDIRPDGKIVAEGFSDNHSGNVLVRYDPDGMLDTGFGAAGVVMVPISTASVELQPDRKIVVAGSSSNGSNNDFALVRYNPNGSLDATFDSDGIVTTPIGPGDEFASSVVIQIDGRIVASGATHNGTNYDFALVRYNPNGSIDTTFGGGDGIKTVDFNNSNEGVYAMALDSQDRGVAVGGSDGAFGLVRFLLEPRRTPFDFDADGRSDVSVFRPSDSVWYLDRSAQGFTAVQFGLSTDKIVPADYDGDGKTDIAIFRDGTWWRINSNNSTVEAVQFGLASDIPVPADYTGDGRDELAVYRGGTWWIYDLANGQAQAIQFGLASDKPVSADYDGDGRDDQAVYRNGEWHINRSTLGYTVAQFGLASDRPVVGNYDGDGKADLAVYRDGVWYLQQSTAGFTALQWGLSTDIPTPADYDGDGKTDAAVFRDGLWYLLQSTSGVSIQQFGVVGDRPIESAYTSQ